MDEIYADTVRLLLRIAPDVFVNPDFAMKGGTAINLFVRDMPRLSIDIDVVYLPHERERQQALHEIAAEVMAIQGRMVAQGLSTRSVSAAGTETKVVIQDGDVQVKVEVNTVFRGTVMPVNRRTLSERTAEMFSAELSVPILSDAELYGSKLVAAMDRQHPRDLYDVMKLYENEGPTADMIECFVTYLAGHNRPIHEVLFARPKTIAVEYENNFRGMTRGSASLDDLLGVRERMFLEIPRLLEPRHREFLVGLANAAPDWSLLSCAHAARLPALRWKVENVIRFARQRPGDLAAHVSALSERLEVGPDGKAR